MKRLQLQGKKKEWILPEKFDELSPAQLLAFAKWSLYRDRKGEPLDRFRILHLAGRTFSRMPPWYYLKLPRTQQLVIEHSLYWLFEDYTMELWLANVRTFPWSKTFYGPGKRMKFLSAAEFAPADMYFNQYAKTNDSAHLNAFSACLMRPGNGQVQDNGDQRLPFRPSYIEGPGSREFKSVPAASKYAIFLNYLGIRALMVSRHPHVFTNDNQTIAFLRGWPAVFYSMAGPKVGTIEQAEAMPIWNLLAIAEQNEIDRIRSEKPTPNG